jgi:arylsulfatase
MPRIALVVLDTLRKDAFDEHFEWLPGRRFENAWSTSHYTVPVHGSMFTGQYPSESGVHAKSELFDYPDPVLPELLVRNGYTTRALHTNPLLEASEFDRGFTRLC